MGAPAARTFEHARHWVALGHDVTVVCGLPNHPDGIVPERYRGKLLFREEIEGVKVLRCWLFATPNRGVFKRSIAFITFMLSAMFFGSFFTKRCDVVVATSPQMLCGLAGYVVSILKRRPFVLEVRDLWPRQIIDLGVVRNGFIIGLLSWLETFLYRRARAIVTVAEATRQEIIGRGFSADKVFTVTNAINEVFFQPGERQGVVREKNGWQDDTIVMYIGTHGLSQGLVTILDAAELLQPRHDIRFVFVGTGAERERLMADAERRYLKNVVFHPMQDKKDVPDYYAAADICLVPLKRRRVFLFNIPSKMFEIMACGRPIILGAMGQAQEILSEAEAGICVEPENAQAYADAITRLADTPKLRAQYGLNGRNHVVKNYTRRQMAAKFSAILEKVV